MSLDIEALVAGSTAVNPKPWACGGCASLFTRRFLLVPGYGTFLYCGHPGLDGGAQLLDEPERAAPAWCPRQWAPLAQAARP